MLNYIMTAGGVHLVVNGRPLAVAKSDKQFEAVVQALKSKASPEEVLAIVDAERIRMEAAIQVADGIDIKGGQLYYKGDVVAGLLGERMSQMLDEGFDLGPMAKFLENLMQNPSFRVIKHLYDFLDYGKNAITEDGCFLAYKAVQKDFTDIRTGNFDNSIGQTLRMPRNKVDEDPARTCSYGFHVCSFDYLPHFSHADGHVVVCKVNPRDVVAIPADYHNTKMRVCEYTVVEEYENYYQNTADKLGAVSVANDGAGGTFSVQYDDGDGTYAVDEAYDRLADAARRMDELLDDTEVARVRIFNTKTEVVVDEQSNDNFSSDSILEEDPVYAIVGIGADGSEHELGEDFDSVADAVAEALNHDGYARIEIRDQDGHVERTLT